MKLSKPSINEMVFATGLADWRLPEYWRDTVLSLAKPAAIIVTMCAILYALPHAITALVLLAERLAYLLF